MKYMINRAFGLRGVLTLLALMLAFAASAQNKITGKVVDENDQPAIGANVVVKGTTQGVSTDLKGMFAIPVKTGDVLVFSYLGYKSQEVKIAAQTRLDIKLVPEANIMDEVVVVGYGAVKRGDLTGSVASVSSKDVEGFKTGSVMEALGGQIAGVQITATDGTPGAGFDIKVRGVGSVNGDTSPLYIVDGFQVDNIDYLSNSDIESIEVLKALADPTRRRILELLAQGDLTAGEIAAHFDMTKPSVSHHLNILKSAALITDERRGQNIVYSVNLTVFQELMKWFYDCGLVKGDDSNEKE